MTTDELHRLPDSGCPGVAMRIKEALEKETLTFNRWEQSTLICALVNYSLQVADPHECIRMLERVCPNPKQPWGKIVTEGRISYRQILDKAEETAC